MELLPTRQAGVVGLTPERNFAIPNPDSKFYSRKKICGHKSAKTPRPPWKVGRRRGVYILYCRM